MRQKSEWFKVIVDGRTEIVPASDVIKRDQDYLVFVATKPQFSGGLIWRQAHELGSHLVTAVE